MLLTSVYLTMLQTLELSESQERLAFFCLQNSIQKPTDTKTTGDAKKKKKIKRGDVKVKTVDQVPRIMAVIGDTLVVRDYIVNDLKDRYNLSVQNVTATTKRNHQTFKSQLFDASQCNASFKESSLLSSMLQT